MLAPEAVASLGCAPQEARTGSGTYWVSAQGSDAEGFGLVALNTSHGEALRIDTDFRGHDVAVNPQRPQQLVLFGRRPARESAVFDLRTQALVQVLEAAPGRAFQGHGFFTRDGGLLVSAEADTQSGAGKLVLRETDAFSIVGELDTYGMEPHEIQLMPDDGTVVIANGGLLTRPETGSTVLNLGTMDSTLSYVDLASGELVEKRRVAERKSSIRHLDVSTDGTVAVGIQVQREALEHDEVVPLAGAHRPGGEIQLFEQSASEMALLNDYVGSVAVSSATRIAGFASPRGNVAMFFHVDSGESAGVHKLADCCGLAVSRDGQRFLLSNSLGEVRVLSARDLREDRDARRRLEGVHWDNHMLEIHLEREPG